MSKRHSASHGLIDRLPPLLQKSGRWPFVGPAGFLLANPMLGGDGSNRRELVLLEDGVSVAAAGVLLQSFVPI